MKNISSRTMYQNQQFIRKLNTLVFKNMLILRPKNMIKMIFFLIARFYLSHYP